MNKAVFLDRDGVLNEAIVREGRPYPPANMDELKLYPDAATALSGLKRAEFLLLVATNQPDVARGTQTREMVLAMNSSIGTLLPIDEFLICWHDDADRCDCRKPKPGLILKAAGKYQIDMRQSFLIGDRWRDIDAGGAAGCRTILIDRAYLEKPPRHPPDFRAASLTAAVDWILSAASLPGVAATRGIPGT